MKFHITKVTLIMIPGSLFTQDFCYIIMIVVAKLIACICNVLLQRQHLDTSFHITIIM